MLKINQIRVRLNQSVDFTLLLSKMLKVKSEDILEYQIIKQSIDARKKDDILFVYDLAVKVQHEKVILSKKIKNVSKLIFENHSHESDSLNYNTDKKVAIIGFGPAGMFAALKFARSGVKVTVFERGEQVEDRIETIETFNRDGVLNTESNIQFGEGGAGTFSDGKLTARKKDSRGKWLFEEFVKAGAPKEILYVNNPHIGTDKLVHVVKHIREEIISLGSHIHFNSKVSDVKAYQNGVQLTVNAKEEYFDYVILAIGHSSRDTIEMLYENKIDIVQKPFAVGFRIEHTQLSINKAQFGRYYNHPSLGAAEYKLTHQTKDGKGVYTFCMCPGGWVVPAASEEGMLVVNGMSEYARDKINANSALLVTVNEEDFQSSHPLAGIEFQRRLERKAFELGGSNYKAPVQLVGDFIRNEVGDSFGHVKASYSAGVAFANLRSIFSDRINNAFLEALPKMGNRLHGFDAEDALLTGVETRSSSPVRILRDKESYQSTSMRHLYPAGEGAGYAGGIVSAAVDGIRIAETILKDLEE